MRISDWSSDVCSSDLLDAARIELEQAQRNGDLARAGELSYGAIPQLTKQLEEAQAVSQGAMLREEVTNADIASVVPRRTGIPVDKMMEGESEKLIHLEQERAQSVTCQDRKYDE